MATNNSKGNTSKGSKASKGKKAPAVKLAPLATTRLGGVSLYTGAVGKHGTGSAVLPHGVGLGGKDWAGNTGGMVPFNRALAALCCEGAKRGERVTLAQVQPVSEALAEAAGFAPADSPHKGRRARNLAANGSAVNTHRSRLTLLSDDPAKCPPGEAPCARGELMFTVRGKQLAEAGGAWKPLTDAERAAVRKYEARIAAAQKASKAGK